MGLLIAGGAALAGMIVWPMVDARARENGQSSFWFPAWIVVVLVVAIGWSLGAGSLLLTVFWSFVTAGIAGGLGAVCMGLWWLVSQDAGDPAGPLFITGAGLLLILLEAAWAWVILNKVHHI